MLDNNIRTWCEDLQCFSVLVEDYQKKKKDLDSDLLREGFIALTNTKEIKESPKSFHRSSYLDFHTQVRKKNNRCDALEAFKEIVRIHNRKEAAPNSKEDEKTKSSRQSIISITLKSTASQDFIETIKSSVSKKSSHASPDSFFVEIPSVTYQKVNSGIMNSLFEFLGFSSPSQGRIAEVTGLVSHPKNPFTLGQSFKEEYELYGFITHTEGHYTAYVRKKNEGRESFFFHCDDKTVTPISKEEFFKQAEKSSLSYFATDQAVSGSL